MNTGPKCCPNCSADLIEGRNACGYCLKPLVDDVSAREEKPGDSTETPCLSTNVRPNAETDVTLATKLIGVGLVLLTAYGLFVLVVNGIFWKIAGNDPGKQIYLLFYGGPIALFIFISIGVVATVLLVLRKRKVPPPAQPQTQPRPANPPSALNRGITLGLITVVAIFVFSLMLFVWGWIKLR